MDANKLLSKLKETVIQAQKDSSLEIEMKQKEQSQKELENLRKKAKQVFNSLMVEDKLIATAKRGCTEYPLLLVKEADHGEGKPTKNKQTGYKYNIGKLGEFIFDELVSNGFEPAMIRIDEYQIEGNKRRVESDFDKDVVSKTGWYLGIKW